MSAGVLNYAASVLAKSPEAIEQTKLVYLGVGYAAVWVAITGYLISISRRQKALQDRLNRLKVDEAPPKN